MVELAILQKETVLYFVLDASCLPYHILINFHYRNYVISNLCYARVLSDLSLKVNTLCFGYEDTLENNRLCTACIC